MPISEKMRAHFERGTAIRKMFEEGIRLKERHGARNVADLSLGNPFSEPPAAFTEALRRYAGQPPGERHRYMPNAGYPGLRRKVAEHLRRRGYFEGIEGRHVFMTAGAAGALAITLKAIMNPGDQVIVVVPYFVLYGNFVDNYGGSLVPVESTADFALDVGAIEAAVTRRTKAVILNSPNNPSGRLYDRQSLRQLADMLARKEDELGIDIFAISDEPYREILYDGREYVSIASLHRNSFMAYSWSKCFNVPGERIGYLAVNPEVRTREMDTLLGCIPMCNLFLGFVNASAIMQNVVAEVLDEEPGDVGLYERKRDRICACLQECGFEIVKPEGAFYIFPKTPVPEAEFVELAKENLVLVAPGSGFGRKDHFRISYAVDDHTVDLACERFRRMAGR